MADQNAYSVLSIHKGVSEQEIKQSYIELVKKYDPENHQARFMLIQAAYETLRDPLRRAKEDLFTYNYIKGKFLFNDDEKGGELSETEIWQELKKVKDMLAENPDNEEAKKSRILYHMIQSHINVNKKLWAEAIKNWNDILSIDPTHTRAKNNLIYSFITLGYSYAIHGLLKEAIDLWEKALKMDPDNWQLIHNLAIANELGGNKDDSKRYWGETLRVWKRELDKNTEDKYLKSLIIEVHKHFGGQALDSKVDNVTAIREYKEILKINPDDFDAQFQICSTMMEEQNWDNAISELTKLQKKHPQNLEVLNLLGWALLNNGQVDLAFNTWKKALSIDNKNKSALENIMRAHQQIGQRLRESGLLTNALVHFKSLLKYNPQNWEAHYEVARTYELKGDVKSAFAEYNIVLQLNPKSKEAKKALSDLKMRH